MYQILPYIEEQALFDLPGDGQKTAITQQQKTAPSRCRKPRYRFITAHRADQRRRMPFGIRSTTLDSVSTPVRFRRPHVAITPPTRAITDDSKTAGGSRKVKRHPTTTNDDVYRKKC